MVRVHVRPPPFHLPAVWPACVFGNGQGRRPATALMGGDSRGLPPSRERPPRLRARGADSFLLEEVVRGGSGRRAPSFFRQAGGA